MEHGILERLRLSREIERLKLQKETKQMDKREYDQLIKTAADLEREAEVECKKEIEKRQKYKEGYMKGIEDFLDSIEGEVKE